MIVCGAIILTAAFAAVIAVKRRRGKKGGVRHSKLSKCFGGGRQRQR